MKVCVSEILLDLVMEYANTQLEYAEDTERIPQSSLVLARRLPAKISGRGKANKYIDGKPPVEARSISNITATRKAAKSVDVNAAQTEEERAAAVLRLGEEQWKQDQQEMANAQRVPMSFNKNTQKKANIPEGEPPHGYICYRCGKKGTISSSNALDHIADNFRPLDPGMPH